MKKKIIEIYKESDGALSLEDCMALSYSDYADVIAFLAGAVINDAKREGIPIEYSLERIHAIIDESHEHVKAVTTN